MKKEYTEKEKQLVRNEALKFAISTSAINRHKSSIARKRYVKDIKEFLQTGGTTYDKEVSSLLTDS